MNTNFSKKNLYGFSLMEAAIAIAVMAILAGAMAPFVLRALNQQRESRTRESMEVAFRALFGSRDKRVPNMLADLGYWPTVVNADLRDMTLRGAMPPWQDSGAGFFWGWNGPYWTGASDGNGAPLDGWGTPFRFSAAGASVQLQSAGPNRRFADGDDFFFPPNPGGAPAANFQSQLIINVEIRNSLGGLVPTAGNYTAVKARNGSLNPPLSGVIPPSGPITFAGLRAGPMQFNVAPTAPAPPPLRTLQPPTSHSQVVDLLPGEIRSLSLIFQVNP